MAQLQIDHVWNHQWSSPTEQLVMLYLATFSDEEGRACPPTCHQMAYQMGMATITVRRSLRKLARRGVLVKHSSDGAHLCYAFDWERAVPKAPAPKAPLAQRYNPAPETLASGGE